ncbi:Putative heterokaryon incompatibility [Septoria linicola]|uniref:Heterokaryon incompatibility n=1 Tax=Septoria linicola TaxID=215465 RepID=A0A9Q9AMP5_9PEZI|nr:putative heterokaryon incompatibility [Septoria linicola]USW52129.1 Putative heterokaryon incompatibility [Septoria linicola]
MRLLVVPEKAFPSKPLRLIEAFGSNLPEFAILSHTWDRDEVSYSDVQHGTSHDRHAYDKVRGATSQARKDGHRYLWIDTCCIDKSSSTELQEAINSMYAWYARAAVCYVYMADVHGTPATEFWDLAFEDHFARSRWFKRGWTLQELIAPKKVSFFSSDWTLRGCRGSSMTQSLR